MRPKRARESETDGKENERPARLRGQAAAMRTGKAPIGSNVWIIDSGTRDVSNEPAARTLAVTLALAARGRGWKAPPARPAAPGLPPTPPPPAPASPPRPRSARSRAWVSLAHATTLVQVLQCVRLFPPSPRLGAVRDIRRREPLPLLRSLPSPARVLLGAFAAQSFGRHARIAVGHTPFALVSVRSRARCFLFRFQWSGGRGGAACGLTPARDDRERAAGVLTASRRLSSCASARGRRPTRPHESASSSTM